LKRRALLGAGAAAAALAACGRQAPATAPAAWVPAHAERGHRLRAGGALPAAALQRRADVLVVGAGIAGLSAARALLRQGVHDVAVLELADTAGGNSRGHVIEGLACPLGAHYLPVPGEQGPPELTEWLHEIGLLRSDSGRTVPDERHLCHSPQERLFIDGAWSEGLLPPADPGSTTAAQYRRYAALVRTLAGPPAERRFLLPAHRARRHADVMALDGLSFAQWLDGHALTDTRLRWYLDYACRDDYGAGIHTVSAWAGIHYFASRHGFHAPGEDSAGEHDAVFTWPEGNAWLVQHLTAPLQGRLHGARTVLQVQEQRHGVAVLAWDEAQQRAEGWQAQRVVLALPLFVAARVLVNPPDALREAARWPHAPWLVANVHIDRPLLPRSGVPAAWDNVIYRGPAPGAAASALGYVDATHQSLRPVPGPTVLTAYHALPAAERGALLSATPEVWRDRVLADLAEAHPDIHERARHVHLMRWGHAMAVPVPGLLRNAALPALRAMNRGRVRFAHADLAGYSTFEEAFIAGHEAAQHPLPQGGRWSG
jgi:predicted NAD/FAD-binding protein